MAELAAFKRSKYFGRLFSGSTSEQDRLCFSRSQSKGNELISHELCRLEIGLVLPPGHRLAGRSEIHFERLRNERWILPPRDATPVLYDELISCCHKAGFTPDVIAEMTQRPRVVAQVACGIGIATSEMFYFGLPRVGQGFQYGNEAKDCGN